MSHVKAFGLAVAFSWAVWITAETVSPFPPHVEKYENRDDAKTAVKQNGSADEPLALRLVEFIDTHNGLVASLATIAIAYFTWSLRQSTDKLWSSSKEQIEFSRNSFVVENRPYLTPVEFVINRIIDASSGRVSEYRFIPQWKNGGQTPAVKIVTVLSAKFFDKSGMPPDFDFPDNVQPIEGRTQGNMAGPGFPFFGPYADLQAVTLYEVMKQWRRYIWTWVEYSAHYDHLGILPASIGDSVAHGADDDGSGSVALLAIARAMRQSPPPRRSVLFVWHTGEEEGLLGSAYFASHPTVPLDSVVALINADMIGRNAPESLYVVGPGTAPHGTSRPLGKVVDSVNASLPSPFAFGRTWDSPTSPQRVYFRGDAFPYGERGVPVVFFTTGLHPDYQQVSDEASRIDYSKLAHVSQLLYELGEVLANRDARPR